MAKIGIVIFSDTESIEALGKVSNALVLASEADEAGDELKIIFEGASVKWIPELEKENNKMHGLYLQLKDKITGACSFCSSAFGVKKGVEQSGVPLLAEYNNHPSLRKLAVEGYEIFSF